VEWREGEPSDISVFVPVVGVGDPPTWRILGARMSREDGRGYSQPRKIFGTKGDGIRSIRSHGWRDVGAVFRFN